MHYHPAIVVFACLGALVLALAVTERELFGGGDDCCKGDKWQAHTAEYKHSVLQEKILSNLKQAGWPGVLLGGIFVESMDPSFDMIRDDLPWDRSKLIHSVGNVAPVEWIVTNASSSKYSGIFKTGGRFGFLRASTAAEGEPDKTDCDPQCAFIPGLSLKMMRDKVPSGNLFGMVALIGQNSFNFFANNMTNHPPLACSDITGSLKLLYMKFRTASKWPTILGLSELARHDDAGVQYFPAFPFQLWFVPNDDLRRAYPDEPAPGWSDLTLAEQLSEIEVGTVVYTIYGLQNPISDPEILGYLRTTGKFTTTYWGDKNMFFQHTRIEDDLEFHPSWAPYLPEC